MASIRSIVTKMDLRVNNCFLYAEEGKTREEERRHPDRGYPGLPTTGLVAKPRRSCGGLREGKEALALTRHFTG